MFYMIVISVIDNLFMFVKNITISEIYAITEAAWSWTLRALMPLRKYSPAVRV